MSKAAVLKVLAAAKPALAKHWASCRAAGLPGDSGEVDEALEVYFDTLSKMKHPAPKTRILGVLKVLFEWLDRINEEAGGGLLETDERELLVPVILEGAAAAGLDVGGFPDGDPTAPFRNF
jgi:hypothetical protein